MPNSKSLVDSFFAGPLLRFAWLGAKFHLLFHPGMWSNEGSKSLQAQTWLITNKLWPHTVLLNLEIVCNLDELSSIKNYSKTIDFYRLIITTVDTTNKVIQIGVWNIGMPITYTLHLSTPHSIYIATATATVIWRIKNNPSGAMFNQFKACNCIQVCKL